MGLLPKVAAASSENDSLGVPFVDSRTFTDAQQTRRKDRLFCYHSQEDKL